MPISVVMPIGMMMMMMMPARHVCWMSDKSLEGSDGFLKFVQVLEANSGVS